jgi:hypothetical protein
MAGKLLLSEADELRVACIAAFKTLIEIMLANSVTNPRQLNECLSHQRDVMTGLGMSWGAEFLENLREFSTDPERNTAREQLRRLLGEPPEGPAGAQ